MVEKKRKIVKRVSTVDSSTGEVLTDNLTTVGYNAEPNYYKMYVENIDKLILLVSPHCLTVFVLACSKMTYEGDLFLPRAIRREFAIKMRVKLPTFDRYLGQLSYAGIIIKKGSNAYIVNPVFVGKGSWVEINKQREEVEYVEQKGRYLHRRYMDYY